MPTRKNTTKPTVTLPDVEAQPQKAEFDATTAAAKLDELSKKCAAADEKIERITLAFKALLENLENLRQLGLWNSGSDYQRATTNPPSVHEFKFALPSPEKAGDEAE